MLYSGHVFASVVEFGGTEPVPPPPQTAIYWNNWTPSALLDIRSGSPSQWSWVYQHYSNRIRDVTKVPDHLGLHDSTAVLMPYIVEKTGATWSVSSLWSRMHESPPYAKDEVLLIGGHNHQPEASPLHTHWGERLVWKIRDPHLSTTPHTSGGTRWEMWSAPLGGTAGEGLHFPRAYPNVVLLPDCSAVVFGGSLEEFHPYRKCGGSPQERDAMPVYEVEILDFLGSAPEWRLSAAQSSPRLYHAMALLLKDGRVLSIGGYKDTINGRNPPHTCTLESTQLSHSDAEVFVPRYLQQDVVRPAIMNDVPPPVAYGQPITPSPPSAPRLLWRLQC